MTTELAVPQENDLALQPQFHAVAVNATEMKAANEGIKNFLRAKVASIQQEIDETQAALDAAIKHKWKSSTFKGIVLRRKQEHMYYGKLLAASEAGYSIVPNMEADIFAIRVKRLNPIQTAHDQSKSYNPSIPSLPDEEEQRLPIGEGDYKSPEQTFSSHKWDSKDDKGEIVHHASASAVEYADLNFPLAVAHPVVMDATAHAMAMKIFDRIGIVNNHKFQRKGDPIVLGQITRKIGWQTKTASFLIAWYLDPRTL